MRERLSEYRWEATLVVLFLLSLVIGATLSPYFLEINNLAHSAAAFVPVALMVLGLFPIVVMGEIDLSLPSILAVATVSMGAMYQAELPIVVVLLGSLALCLALGILNGVLVARFGLPAMAVTLGGMGAYRGLAYLIAGDSGVSGIEGPLAALGGSWVWWIPVPVIVFVCAALAIWLLMERTEFGSFAYGIGSAARAVRSAGISVENSKIGAYVIGAAMAWIAGVVWVGEYASARGDNANGTIMLVLTGVVLGGVSIYGGSGRASGVVLAIALLFSLQTGMSLANVPGTTQTLVSGLVLLIAVIVPNIKGFASLTKRFQRRGRSGEDARSEQ